MRRTGLTRVVALAMLLSLVAASLPALSAGGAAAAAAQNYAGPQQTWYLAEGFTGGSFDTYVLVQNPNNRDAKVVLDFQLPKGATAPSHPVTVPKGTRATVHLDDLPGLKATDVSTRVRSDVPVFVERSMYFNYYGKPGGHDSVGIEKPSGAWYFAEGYTGGDFDTFILVQNTNDRATNVTLNFLLPDGKSATPYTFDLAANSRRTVHLDAIKELTNTEVSTAITSTFPVIAERAMYFNYDGRVDGSCSIGTADPNTDWYLAEGCTLGNFDTYVLLLNPSLAAVKVTLNFQPANGQTANPYSFTMPGKTRQTVHLNGLPGLAGKDVATYVQASQPVVAERSMYFNYKGRAGGHCSVGYQSASTASYLAEGYTSPDFDTYVLVQNPGTGAAKVTLEFQLDSGGSARPYSFDLPGMTRKSVHLNELPGLANTGVSTTVKSDAAVVAERSEYFDYNGKTGGSCSIGAETGVDLLAPDLPSVKVGAVTINWQGLYYEVTIDMTKGNSHYQIGQQYGKAIKKIFKNFEYNISHYLSTISSLLLLKYGITGWDLAKRAKTIKDKLPGDYRDELAGLISSMDGTFWWSGSEEIYVYNLFSDVARGTQCCAFSTWGNSSSEGSTIACRTLDWLSGFGELTPLQAVTRYHYKDRDLYLIGALGHVGCITGINRQANDKSSGVMGAILDSGVDDTKYNYSGYRSYNFDLRYELEHAADKEEIARDMADPGRKYTYTHLIYLADKNDSKVLENNISGKGDPAQRALRTDQSVLQDFIHWGYPSMIGVVNCFSLKGQVNNYSEGENKICNPKRWQLMRAEIEERWTKENNYKLTPQQVKEIMSSYWGAAPTSIYWDPDCGDLYNSDIQQMCLYVPAQNSLKVFFKPADGSVPLDPKLVPIPLP